MTLALLRIEEGNTQPFARTAQISNSPVPSETSSTTIMTVLMHFAVQVMKSATTSVKITFSTHQKTLLLANNDTGTAAQLYKHEKTKETLTTRYSYDHRKATCKVTLKLLKPSQLPSRNQFHTGYYNTSTFTASPHHLQQRNTPSHLKQSKITTSA